MRTPHVALLRTTLIVTGASTLTASGAEGQRGLQPTTLRLEPAVGVRQDVAPMGVHYFLVGGRYEPGQSGRIMPFFVAGGGATLFDARRNAAGIDYGSEWLFAFRFAGGGTAWLTSRIPERRQQRLVAAVQQIMRGFPPTK